MTIILWKTGMNTTFLLTASQALVNFDTVTDRFVTSNYIKKVLISI